MNENKPLRELLLPQLEDVSLRFWKAHGSSWGKSRLAHVRSAASADDGPDAGAEERRGAKRKREDEVTAAVERVAAFDSKGNRVFQRLKKTFTAKIAQDLGVWNGCKYEGPMC